MDAWLPRLVKIRIPGQSHGTGWAVGQLGVLTTRTVVQPLMAGGDQGGSAEVGLAEVVLAEVPDRSFAAYLVWSDEDLALLSISERHHLTWQTVLRTRPGGLLARPRAGELPPVSLYGVAVPPADTTSVAWVLAPTEHHDGTIEPIRETGTRGFIEVDRSTVSRAVLRRGVTGGAIIATESEPMLLGIVTARARGRRRIRFEFTTVPDPATDADFALAMRAVQAEPVLYDMDGPLLRRFVTDASLDESLRPLGIRDIPGPAWFGTYPARHQFATSVQPFGPYVARPERAALSEALTAAVAGTGPRVVILRGPSAAGKSRLVAEVLSAHPGLADHRIIAPRPGVPILDLPERLLPDRVIIWMDDLDSSPALALRHDRLRRHLADHPGTIVIATVTDAPDPAHGLRLIERGIADDAAPVASSGLSPIECILDDDVLTVTVPVAARPTWSPRGSDEDTAVAALADASKKGLGLGEYLAGYDVLADHYTAARWPARVLSELAADWARSGIGRPLPLDTARELWQQLVPTTLPKDELLRFQRFTPAELDRYWTFSVDQACDPVTPAGALVHRVDGGLSASRFARVHVDRGAIFAAMWEHLLGVTPTTPADRLDLGLAALGSGTPQRALRAFESILFFRDSDPAERDRLVEVIARRGIALYHTRAGRVEQAVMVYTDLVDTFAADDDADIAEQVAQSMLGIGLLFSSLGSDGQAVSAYTELVNRYRDHPSPIIDGYVATALLGQATTLAQLGRREEERSAYADIIGRYGADGAPSIAAIVGVARRALADSGAGAS